MVSSVFDAMETFGVAGEGLNRLINRDEGGTGPDEAPDLDARGGSGGDTAEYERYGKGKGKGKAEEETWYREGKGKGKGV